MTYAYLLSLPATAEAEAAGFELSCTGGSCWAYTRNVPSGHVEVSDYLETLTDSEEGPTWTATRYRADEGTATYTQRTGLTLQEALRIAPTLPDPAFGCAS